MAEASDLLAKRLWRIGLPAFLALVALASCESPTEPLPSGAVAIDPVPSQYRTWWQEMEVCSGRTGDFDAISWYYVPNALVFRVGSNPNVKGYWQPYHRSITLAGLNMYDDYLVRHEALHAILRTADHPPLYFVDKCGSLLSTAPIFPFD